MSDKKIRCFGNKPGQEFYAKYHDEEWGRPKYNDRELFELLILEGAQAGLSWETILKRREDYRKAFYNFEIERVANMTDAELENLLNNSNIIKNRQKIFSARINAIVFLKIKTEFGSFSDYIWKFVDNNQIINKWNNIEDMPPSSHISDEIAKDLKKRGMKFVGSTIIYAYMQAAGLVWDHFKECWLVECT